MPIINQVVAGSGGSAPAHYIEYTVDANGDLGKTNTVMSFSGVTGLQNNALQYAYSEAPITGIINFSDLTSINGHNSLQNAFYKTRITGIYLGKVQIMNGNSGCQSMCYECSQLTGNLDLSSLVSIGGSGGGQFSSAFYGCNITSVDVKKLEAITVYSVFQSAFQNNKNLKTLQFQSLKTLTQNGVFYWIVQGGTAFQSFWFYALTPTSFGTQNQQFRNMCNGTTGVTVHFPMAIQSTIGSWSDVTNGFGGTNTTVLFDIVTTLTGADANTYTRSEKDSTSTATAWVYNDTLYYTSGVSDNTNGVNEPAVSDAIYSDAACTQSVTTITAIA